MKLEIMIYNQKSIKNIMQQIRKVAIEYYNLTGKPLGVTGEIAEYEAARILGLKLCVVRQAGYDAFKANGKVKMRVQIKGRRLTEKSKSSQRLGKIRTDQKWDSVMYVELNARYEAVRIYEASRKSVVKALNVPGSKARARGALGVQKFKSIGSLIWSKSEYA